MLDEVQIKISHFIFDFINYFPMPIFLNSPFEKKLSCAYKLKYTNRYINKNNDFSDENNIPIGIL